MSGLADHPAPPMTGLSGVLYHSWPRPDGSLHLEFLSAGAEEMLEATAAEVSAWLTAGTMPLVGVDAAAFYATVGDSVRRHEPWAAEFGYVGPRSGRVRWLRAQDFPCESPTGVPYFTGVLLDITAWKDAEARAARECATRAELDRQLAEARQYEALGVLAGGIAHDFNNLLTVILGNASIAREEVTDPAVAAQMADIESAAVRAADLCGQLTAYAGVGRMAVGPVDLAGLLAENGTAFRAAAGRAALTVHAADGLPTVTGDPRQLRQLIQNLIANGAEAMDGAGTVAVRVEPADDDRVRIRVTDSGRGMDAATQARMFDPFFTTKFTGRGLGLAAVKGVVRGHKGAIRVASEPGRGTTVEIDLPAAGVERPNPLFDPAPATARPALAALVVDDEMNVRELIASALEDNGYRVTMAANGLSAVALVEADPMAFAVAVVDLMMPDLTGDEVIRRLRRLRPGLPVVIASGYSDRPLPDDVLTSGPTAVLPKPFRLDALTSVVRRTAEAAGK
jgi:signal transduction histidine kinase/CheY-like chemotaxis protein